MEKTNFLLENVIPSDSFWNINKLLARKIGIKVTLLLSDLISKRHYFRKENKLIDNEWFFNTQENIENNTTLSPYEQRKSIKILMKNNFIEVKQTSSIHRSLYFKINDISILKYLNSHSEKTSPSIVKNFNTNNNKENNNKENASINNIINKVINDPKNENNFSTSVDIEVSEKKENITSTERSEKEIKNGAHFSNNISNEKIKTGAHSLIVIDNIKIRDIQEKLEEFFVNYFNIENWNDYKLRWKYLQESERLTKRVISIKDNMEFEYYKTILIQLNDVGKKLRKFDKKYFNKGHN